MESRHECLCAGHCIYDLCFLGLENTCSTFFGRRSEVVLYGGFRFDPICLHVPGLLEHDKCSKQNDCRRLDGDLRRMHDRLQA